MARELDLGNYAWPPRGSEAEKISFKLQVDAHITEFKTPTDEELSNAYEHILPMYPKHTLPDFLSNYNREVWRKQIQQMKTYIKPEASPGVPYSMIANRNDDLFRILGSEFEDIVLDRIEKRLYYSLDVINDMSRQEKIDRGLVDPVRLFVKDEPHKLSKIKEGRVRLIHSVSIVDKMIEMLLSRHICKLEIENWWKIPSKPGIGFTDEMNSLTYDYIMRDLLDMAFADVSGWDMSVKMWMLIAGAELRILACLNPSPVWNHLVTQEPFLEGEPVFQFSDGELVCPDFQGIVTSGKLKTASENSRIRVLLGFLVGGDKMKRIAAAGDDTVESYVEDAIAKYLEYGIKIKDYQRVGEGFEFCSRWYEKKGSYPLNVEKMLINILHSEPKDEFETECYLCGFVDQMQHHPKFPCMMRLLEEVGYIHV
jgi:hypothetical protein